MFCMSCTTVKLLGKVGMAVKKVYEQAIGLQGYQGTCYIPTAFQIAS